MPAGDWFCSLCLKEKFGFSTTRVYKYHQYERQANSFKHAFFESLFETATTKLTKRKKEGAAQHAYEAEARAVGRARLPDLDVPPDEVEWQFWNIVQTPDQPLEVGLCFSAEVKQARRTYYAHPCVPASLCGGAFLLKSSKLVDCIVHILGFRLALVFSAISCRCCMEATWTRYSLALAFRCRAAHPQWRAMWRRTRKKSL